MTRAAPASFRVGRKVLAFYEVERKFYDAVVISADHAFVKVRYVGYNDVASVGVGLVRPIPPLPDGWEEQMDESSGWPYFQNARTGETSWTRPANAAAGGALARARADAAERRVDRFLPALDHERQPLAVAGGALDVPASRESPRTIARRNRLDAQRRRDAKQAVVAAPPAAATIVGGFAKPQVRAAMQQSQLAVPGGFARRPRGRQLPPAQVGEMTTAQIRAMIQAANDGMLGGFGGGCGCGVAGC